MGPELSPAARAILAHGRSLAKGATTIATLLLVGLTPCLFPGCAKKPKPLHLRDLSPGESTYITRVITLERAKAVTLANRQLGYTLLDSLRLAWGDSSLERTAAGLPVHPTRARQVNELLARMLAAEQDSLIHAPRPDRLGAPLPDPQTPANAP